MARYPKAFEAWYRRQVYSARGQLIDDAIIGMRDRGEVKTLAEGEARMRRMLFIEWQLENGKEAA